MFEADCTSPRRPFRSDGRGSIAPPVSAWPRLYAGRLCIPLSMCARGARPEQASDGVSGQAHHRQRSGGYLQPDEPVSRGIFSPSPFPFFGNLSQRFD